jgi:NAD(P)-dependent dehydrogenase (short-subunit alcohol dehydrogenase family)
MGEGLACDLISKGWAVACVDILEQAGKALVAELGSNAHFIKCDIADYDDQAKMYTEVWQKWGRLDALLANAGIVDRSSIYILDYRDSDRYGVTRLHDSINAKTLMTRCNTLASRPSLIQHVPMLTTRQSCTASSWPFILCGRTPRPEVKLWPRRA